MQKTLTKSKPIFALILIAIFSFNLATTSPVYAAKKNKSGKSSKSVKFKNKPPKVFYANGQTEEQRKKSEARRLTKECKGRPNAGACRGYAN